VMDAASVSEETRCDYHVCEAISQAMSLGAQLVPRARITQLMQERAVDMLRGIVQEIIDEGLPIPQNLDDFKNFVQPVPTERPVLVAMAWAGPVADEAAASVDRRLIVITSRLNLLIFGFKPGSALIEEDGGPPPGKHDLEVVSYRDLRHLRHTIVDRRMRQFLGLWWDKSHRIQREVIVFESSSRRRNFQHMLRMVERHRQPNQKQFKREFRRGVPSVFVRTDVMESLQVTSKKDVKNDVRILNVTFVRSRKGSDAQSGGYFAAQSQEQVDVLVLTVDTLCAITLSSFLQRFARSDDAHFYEEAFAKQADGDDTPEICTEELETDSEGEDNILARSEAGQTFDGIDDCQELYGSPWELKSLQGVWFLAEPQPRVKLQFEKPELISFARDGERQRWRRKLASVLGSQDRRKPNDQAKGNQGWSVVPTGKTEIGEVKKHAQAKQRELLQERPALAGASLKL